MEDLLQGLDHRTRVHHLPIHNHLRPQRGVAQAHEPQPFAGLFYLADLDRRGADVDADQVSSFAHDASRLKPTHTKACRKTLASADSDSQKTGDSTLAADTSRNRKRDGGDAVSARCKAESGPQPELNSACLFTFMNLTQLRVATDPVPRLSQRGAKSAPKAWPRRGRGHRG